MGTYGLSDFNEMRIRVTVTAMKISKLASLLTAAYLLSMAGTAFAAIVDTIDSNSGQANTYFVPTVAEVYDDPYFRYAGEDWGWQHNAIGGVITSASISISAFDVDNPSSFPGTYADEIDEIQLYNNDTAAWETIGSLDGTTNTFSFTTFNLGASWFDEIAAGLMVQILIDQNDTFFWGVSLAKSVLSIDGGTLPDPNPNPIPVPAAVWLFGTALLGLAGFGRRNKKT